MPRSQSVGDDGRPDQQSSRQSDQQAQPDRRPIRTVVYIEVGSMPPVEIRRAIDQIAQHYSSTVGTMSMVYVIPVRNGRLQGDVVFESEILEMVRALCEVGPDGSIVMKGGERDVRVVRENAG